MPLQPLPALCCPGKRGEGPSAKRAMAPLLGALGDSSSPLQYGPPPGVSQAGRRVCEGTLGRHRTAFGGPVVGPRHPQRESPATGSPTQPGAVSVLGCSRMFCERKPHVDTLQGEPPPHLRVEVPLNRVTRGSRGGEEPPLASQKPETQAAAGWLSSGAGAAVGSESWLCPHPTSHPRHWIVCGKYSLTWPLATTHFPTG